MSSKTPALELDMMVDERFVRKKAGRPPLYKLILKGDSGNRLTLVSDSKAVYDGFPENTVFQVRIAKVQEVLSKTFEHVVDIEEEETEKK